MTKRKRQIWAKSIGRYGARIRLAEDPASGILYAEFRDPTLRCGYRCRSLRHRDKGRAERWAYRQLAQLEQHEKLVLERTPTLGIILDLYRQHQSPKKCAGERQGDERRAMLWTKFLGVKKDLRRITRCEWDSFVELRGSGAIDSRGNPVDVDTRRPVRDSTVAGDLIFLRAVLRWATRWQSDDGTYLLAEDVTRGFSVPVEKNPRRPVATTDRFDALMAVADQVMMTVSWAEKRVCRQSYLAEVLTLVHHTGRRVSAVLSLRFEDLRLDQGPLGSIRWPAHSDKLGLESLIPISAEVRAAVDQIILDRPGIRGAFLFPSAKDFGKPISIDRCREWLVEAERLAGVEKHRGSLFHAYRRGWATARKHLPDIDVAVAGGWTDTSTLRSVYQQPDQGTLFEVVSQAREIREVLDGSR